jgi:uncharacterized delta-60 repeat protein
MRAPALAVCSIVVALVAIAAHRSALGATTSTTIGATVLSATSINVDDCASGTPLRTDFGNVLTGSANVLAGGCVVRFGSSNDTARLAIAQTDGRGNAMWTLGTGDIDTTFGPSGVRLNDMVPAPGWDSYSDVVIDRSGRLVAAGKCADVQIQMCLQRLLPDGSPDPTFHGGTPATFDDANVLSANWNNDSNFYADVEIDSSGRILAAGTCNSPGQGHDFCIARVLADGSPDPTFGVGGIQVYQPGGDASFTAQYASTMLLESDGRIVIGGTCTNAANDHRDPCVVFLTANGQVDTARGDAAATTFLTPPGVDPVASRYAAVTDLLPLPGGRILASARCDLGNNTFRMCLVRLDPAGRIDTTWGSSGWAFPFAPGVESRAIAMLGVPGGDVLIAGACGANAVACIARVDPSGVLVPSFGTGGFVLLATGSAPEYAFRIVANPVGDDVDIGAWCGSSPTQVCVMRMDGTTGALRTSFGTGGIQRFTFVNAAYETVYGAHLAGMVRDADGSDLVAANCNAKGDSCMARTTPGSTMPDAGSPGSGWTGSGGIFGACLPTSGSFLPSAWAFSATCNGNNGEPWNPIPPTSTVIAISPAPRGMDIPVDIRFGLHVAAGQPPGVYTAPVTFDVVAP